VKVVVLRTDIEAGRPGSPRSCPIARALFRARFGREVPDIHFGQSVEVGHCGVVVREMITTTSWHVQVERAELPPEARAFITNFDAGADVEPIEFELDLKPAAR